MDMEHDFNLSNADVLFCSETRFQESDAKLLTGISGMHSFRNDAVIRGTQETTIWNCNIFQAPSRTTAPNYTGVEILVFPVKGGYDNSIKVMAVYKPPAVPLHCLLLALYCAVKKPSEDGQLIIMGDFNVGI